MTYLTQGIVLRRDHLADNDRRYVIYTLDFGKVNAVIKGAKKITSKLNSHLDYFCISDLMLAQGVAFERVASARLAKKFSNIGSDIYKSWTASYFCEIVDACIKYSLGDQMIFLIISNFYNELNQGQDKKGILLALNKSIFELLKRLGYQPEIIAKNQKDLLFDLNNSIQEISEKEIKSFQYLTKLLV